LFEGKGVADGKKSIGIRLTLQPVEKTLTDEEIEKVAGAVVAAVSKATDGTLRG
jgi:phenylalanyl-tRNA synthetase beta chain